MGFPIVVKVARLAGCGFSTLDSKSTCLSFGLEFALYFLFFLVPAGSPSHGGDVTLYL